MRKLFNFSFLFFSPSTRSRSLRACFFLLPFTFFLFPLQVNASVPPQTLIKGQAQTIEVDYEIGDVAITDQAVCDFVVQDNRREIYLNPKKEGRATLTTWDTKGQKQDSIPITIVSIGLKDILEEAQATFSSSGRLKIFTQDGVVMIHGEVASTMDMARLQAFTARFPQVRTEVRLASAVLETITNEIEKAIGMPGIKVRNVRDRLILDGVAFSADASKRAEAIARLYDENVMNLIEVRDAKRRPGQDKLVLLDVHFMEIKKNALRNIGIQWAPGSVPADGGGGANAGTGGGGSFMGGLGNLGSSLIGFVFNLAPKLRFLRQKGDGRVLENPSFVVKSGEGAEFFSGTQVPFYSAESVTFKDVGVKIQAEPIVASDDVDLKITATITSPTAGGVTKGIDTNTITTTAYCKAGVSMALAGLYRNSDARLYNRIPEGLNTSSALFTLFLSKDFLSNRSEFVIFVTPKIVDQVSPAVAELKEWLKLNEEITKERSKKEWKKEYGQGPQISAKDSKTAVGNPETAVQQKSEPQEIRAQEEQFELPPSFETKKERKRRWR